MGGAVVVVEFVAWRLCVGRALSGGGRRATKKQKSFELSFEKDREGQMVCPAYRPSDWNRTHHSHKKLTSGDDARTSHLLPQQPQTNHTHHMYNEKHLRSPIKFKGNANCHGI